MADPPLGPAPRAIVLVEGASDQIALEVFAARVGRNLGADGVVVEATGGATNMGRFLELWGPRGMNLRLAGLCDAAETDDLRRGLERAGFGSDLSRRQMERMGFYVCEADLEDELIRCLGAPAVERVVAGQGELGQFRTFQNQPAWRGRASTEQLRRFMGTRSGRKIRYGRLLVNALDLTRVPRPLAGVLGHV